MSDDDQKPNSAITNDALVDIERRAWDGEQIDTVTVLGLCSDLRRARQAIADDLVRRGRDIFGAD